jgi:adenylate cyclase
MTGAIRDAQSEEIERLLSAGDFILASDTAEKAIETGNASLRTKHLSVLSLARSGATDLAIRRYNELELHNLADTARPAHLKTSIRALWARLLKDKALSSDGDRRSDLLSGAADAYEKVFRSDRSSYPAVNAATLKLLAGDIAAARKLADSALRALARERTQNGFWGAVTSAEARLVLSDVSGASGDLARAAKLARSDYSSIAVSRRQLLLVCESLKIAPDVLSALSLPSVIQFCGHEAGERIRSNKMQIVRSAIREALARLNVGFGFGALSAGSDILFAEELLRRGAELHVVLPFEITEFERISVSTAGGDWSERFAECIARAKSVYFATSDSATSDRSVYDYSTKLAIGFAQLRAHFLGSRMQQCAVWDGAASDGPNDFVSGIAICQKLKLSTTTIHPKTGNCATVAEAPLSQQTKPVSTHRMLKAMIFGDFKGFSKLQEHQIESFTRGVLGALANVIKRHAADIAFRNTWGDGLYLVVNSSSAASRLALALQDAMKNLPLEEIGLPPTLGLRLGAHFGPVFSLVEPITGTQNFLGTHVSRTARIEPVTPEGAVYVTDAFAADVAADASGSEFSLTYVGNIRAAKGYGNLRMYALGDGSSR